MNEFDEFLTILAEDLYEIERDKNRMTDFYITAKRQLTRTRNDLDKEMSRMHLDNVRIRNCRKKHFNARKYKENIEREIKRTERQIKRVNRFIEEGKKIKLVIMAYRVGGSGCQSMSLRAQNVSKKPKKYSKQTKKKK